MTPRVLVAGIGNIFLGDDGWGVEVARRLSEVELPEDVVVADYGISGMHLAYDLAGADYRTTILLDATQRGDPPGTVTVAELDPGAVPPGPLDAHGMQPDVVLGLLTVLGGEAGRLLLVGCEPESVTDRMGLSAPVLDAVDPAVRRVTELVRAELGLAPPVAAVDGKGV
jgi:hydrogenase maturation protease